MTARQGICLLISLVANMSMSHAYTKTYSSSYDQSEWEVHHTRLICEISHDIRGYGQITFVKEAGLEENGYLRIHQGMAPLYDQGELVFMPPFWKKKPKESRDGWKFQIGKSTDPIEFSGRQTRQMLLALSDGYTPTIIHQDASRLTDRVQANIMPTNFGKSYEEYLNCQAELVPISFEQMRDTHIHFETASTRIDRESLELLEYVVAFTTDPNFRQIDLSGYTDSIGSFRANHKLATDRTEAVKAYLMEHGVSEETIKVRVYGEHRPVADNRTSKGRAKNRRVEVKLYR